MYTFQVVVVLVLLVELSAFTTRMPIRSPRVKPLNENFFLDIAEDPAINTPKEIFGEVAYRDFVEEYDSKALLVGNYDIIERIRDLKLLSLTADSGLLEALEAKGLSLSQVEKILPVVDELELLPLLVKNKGLVLQLAPLLIEPAPLLLPVLSNILKTPSSTFLLPGAALIAGGAYEAVSDNLLLAIPLILLGLPLTVLGSVLGQTIDIPAVKPSPVSASKPSPAAKAATPKVSVPQVAVPKVVAPKVAAPKVSAPKVAAKGTTKRRKVVKIK